MLRPDTEGACFVSARAVEGTLRLSGLDVEPKEGKSQEGKLHQLCEISLGLTWRSGAFPVDISVDYRGVEKFDVVCVCEQSA